MHKCSVTQLLANVFLPHPNLRYGYIYSTMIFSNQKCNKIDKNGHIIIICNSLLCRFIDFQYNKIDLIEGQAFAGSPPVTHVYIRNNILPGKRLLLCQLDVL